MNRRNFLRDAVSMACGAGAFLLENPLVPSLNFARAQTSNKTLVIVFQRGGADGLSEIVPYGDPEYYALRDFTAIPAPNSGQADSALALWNSDFFGLHPSLGPLLPIYDSGNMLIYPTAHYNGASRSHFTGQDWIESGTARNGFDGWLNRHIQVTGGAGPVANQIRAVGVGSSLPHVLQGPAVVSTFNRLRNFTLGLEADEAQFVLDRLLPVYEQPADPARAYQELVHATGRVVVNDLGVVAGLPDLPPEHGAVYPNNTFGEQMRDVARLIKAGVGLELASLGIGGWDTHSNQGDGNSGGRMARALSSFAQGIAAMYTDLGPERMEDVVILTMTEFGRTSRENGSRGTDHGNGTMWLAIGEDSPNGGAFNGGRIEMNGPWPGLGLEDLFRERYLQHTVDFRDILGDVLTQHLGNTDITTVLPDHNYETTGMFI